MNIREHLVKYDDLLDRKIVRKRGGVNGAKTEIRGKIAKMVDRKIVVISSLTKGWTHSQMFALYNKCQAFTKNPPALFWKEYKKIKSTYEKKDNTRGLRSVGKKSRADQQKERQGVLF